MLVRVSFVLIFVFFIFVWIYFKFGFFFDEIDCYWINLGLTFILELWIVLVCG